MYLSIYSENTEVKESTLLNDATLFFSTKISLSEIKPGVTFKDLIAIVLRELESDPPSKMNGKIYYFQLFQIAYWAQNEGQQFYQTIHIPSDLTEPKFPLLAKKDGTYRVHFYAKHKHIGNKTMMS